MTTKTTLAATQNQAPNNRADLFKWVCLALIVVFGIVGNFLLMGQSPWYYIAGLWVGVLAIGAAIVAWTSSGKQLVQFFGDARLELRKVVWPTRQETFQATLMVLAAVVVMSLLLWLIDMVLYRAINFLTT